MTPYEFIEAEKANYSVSELCSALDVSRSGYSKWRTAPPSRRARDHSASARARGRPPAPGFVRLFRIAAAGLDADGPCRPPPDAAPRRRGFCVQYGRDVTSLRVRFRADPIKVARITRGREKPVAGGRDHCDLTGIRLQHERLAGINRGVVNAAFVGCADQRAAAGLMCIDREARDRRRRPDHG